jgi:drug/metabolite transporter (DMT)-like permease
MTTGVFVLVLGVVWWFSSRHGHGIIAALAAIAIGVMLAAGGGPLASTALALIDGLREVLTTIGNAISSHR